MINNFVFLNFGLQTYYNYSEHKSIFTIKFNIKFRITFNQSELLDYSWLQLCGLWV